MGTREQIKKESGSQNVREQENMVKMLDILMAPSHNMFCIHAGTYCDVMLMYISCKTKFETPNRNNSIKSFLSCMQLYTHNIPLSRIRYS